MESGVLISIIVPIYKVEEYLPKCLNSILAQTFQEFEVLLIDDGSPDDSGQIAEEYAARDPRFKVFHKENGGVSSARNYGIKKAQGLYVAFCDSDDWVDPDWLETLYRQMIEYSVDLSVCGLMKEDEMGKVLFTVKEDHVYIKNKEEALLTLFNRDEYYLHQGWVFNKLYKREILIENCIYFNEEIYYCEDRLFNFLYLQHGTSAVYSTIPKYHYLIRKNSAMTSYQDAKTYHEKYSSFMIAFEMMLKYDSSYSHSVKQALVCNYILDSINLYIKYSASTAKKEIYKKVRNVIVMYIKILPLKPRLEYSIFLIHPRLYKFFIYIRWKLSLLKKKTFK